MSPKRQITEINVITLHQYVHFNIILCLHWIPRPTASQNIQIRIKCDFIEAEIFQFCKNSEECS